MYIIDKSKIPEYLKDAIAEFCRDAKDYILIDSWDDIPDLDGIDDFSFLDDDYLNNDKESLEARFTRCKEHVKSTNPRANEYAVCSYLNPRIDARRRALLKKRMSDKRKSK